MERESSLISRMKQVEYFKKLSAQDITTIVRSGEFLHFPAETMIFQEDACSYGMCVLLKGEVHLYKVGEEGQENIMAVILPVIMFNEAAAIDCLPNPVSAVAFKSSFIWRVNCKDFQAGLERFPKLGLGLLPILARRNRKLISKYADLSFRPVSERLAILLLQISERGEKAIDRSENTIQQLAAHIATNPVMISRILGEFRDAGIVETSRQKIIILHPEELAEQASIELDKPELSILKD